MRVRQMTNNYNGNSVMNHFIITDGNKTILQSYDSIVAIVDKDKLGLKSLTLGRDWDYSRTTMKYVHQFLEQTLGWNVTARKLRQLIDDGEIHYDSALN